MSNYYFGTPAMSLTIPAPAPAPAPLTNWPLTLLTADALGNASYKVPYAAPGTYTQPIDITVAYVPTPSGPLDLTQTGETILALPGVVKVVTPFPTSFGPSNFDQTVPVVVPGPLPTGPITVVLMGRIS